MAKYESKDQVAEAYMNGWLNLEKALLECVRLGDIPRKEELDQWSEERSRRKEARREANQKPTVFALGLILGLLTGAITWVIFHEALGMSDSVSLTAAHDFGIGSLIVFLIGALTWLAEERSVSQ